MSSCININSAEFQTLKKKSGISEFQLEVQCKNYLDKYGRFPYLDELDGDSTQYLKDQIHIKDNNSAKISDIINYTNSETIEEANIKINDEHKDLEVQITPLNQEALIDIQSLPSEYKIDNDKQFDASNVNSRTYLNHIINKFSYLYGIKFKTITTSELANSKIGSQIIDPETKSAFIYNGDIYINTDIASIDDPIHEILHLFLGGMRFKQPKLYFQLIQTAEQFEGYDYLREMYKFKTQQDVNEEIFVKELARKLTGLNSQLDNLDSTILHEIDYNTHRMLDIALKGKYSSKSLGNEVFNLSLKQLAEILDSSEMKNQFQTSLGDAQVHRILANRKSELLESKELKQICN